MHEAIIVIGGEKALGRHVVAHCLSDSLGIGVVFHRMAMESEIEMQRLMEGNEGWGGHQVLISGGAHSELDKMEILRDDIHQPPNLEMFNKRGRKKGRK